MDVEQSGAQIRHRLLFHSESLTNVCLYILNRLQYTGLEEMCKRLSVGCVCVCVCVADRSRAALHGAVVSHVGSGTLQFQNYNVGGESISLVSVPPGHKTQKRGRMREITSTGEKNIFLSSS
jgi:hypothetical protein